MKKFLVICLSMLLIFSVFGCSGGNTTPQNNAEKPNDEGIPKQTIKVTHSQAEGTPEDKAVRTFVKKVEELSGGNITCELYPAGQIGSIPESVQSLQMGVSQVYLAPCAIVASYCDDIAVIDLPYILPKDTSVVSKVMNGEIGREYMDRLDSAGMHALGFWFCGFREMTSKKPITGLSDMKGLKMRIMESNLLTSTFKALGAQPIVVAYSETYNALANGTVEAQENPPQSTYMMNFYEVQKYIVETYHASQGHMLAVNGNWWNGLDDASKQVILEAEKAGRDVLDEEIPKYAKNCIDKMVAAGCEYSILPDEQIEEFKKATSSVYDEFLTTEWRKDFVPRLEKAFSDALNN